MPSIPQSLLWISLVVLWLFVLVPMLINKRDTVRRTSDVALATRVLNSGGRTARLIKRGRPAAGHRSDPDWQPEAEDEFEDFDEDETGPVVVTGNPTRGRSVAVVTSPAEEQLDYLDVEVVDFDSGALPVAKAANDPVAEAAPERIHEPAAEAPTDDVPREFASAKTEFGDRRVHEPDPAAVAQAEPEHDGTADEYEYIEDSSGLEPEADEPVGPAARSVRYATKTAAAVSARKYRFRTRMLVTMAVLLVVSASTAYLVTPAAWYTCATLAVITLLYLAYLRRQTRIEERLRRRRMQRMARSRLGVESTEDQELDVVPARLKRPGAAVLEIDDEDPVFEHLEYTSFAREYDMPRAAGQ